MWARQAGKPGNACPLCVEQVKHLPARKRIIHILPCPVHGNVQIFPENLLPLQLSQFRLLKWQRARESVEKWELVPDFPAILAAIQIYENEEWAEMCDKLLLVLSQQTH